MPELPPYEQGYRPALPEPATRPDADSPEPEKPFRPVERTTEPKIVVPVHEYHERHIHSTTYVHPETVVMPEEQPKKLTPVKEKELTPVKQTEPEKINAKINDPPQNNNFSGTKPLIFSGPKLSKKLQFKAKVGRQRTNEQVEELLTFVQMRGSWPHGISDQMQRYYRREYPEYFRKTRKKGNTGKVPVVRPTPIDLQTRRHGTGV